MRRGSFIAVAMMCTPVAAFAAKYGTAGCGLGSIVFGDDPGIVQIFAATTNGTSGNQTFGITTGTSNCEGGEASAALDQEAFVKVNYASLARDAASGEGQYLAALSTLLGCDPSVQAEFFNMTQASYADVFTSDSDAAHVLAKVKGAVSSDAVLASSCERI